MLTPEQMRQREGRLTASAVGALMSGDDEKVMNLWRSMIGDPGYRPDDLTGVWPVRLGETTEQLNLDWYEFKTGNAVTRRGEVVVMEGNEWAAATLDGWVTALSAPIECKHVGGYEPYDRVLARYMPQMHWQMIVTKADQCIFSVIEGAKEPLRDPIQYDENYGDELWARARRFMECVETLTPPVIIAPAPAPVRPTVTYDMTGKNEWASYAVTWLENFDGKKKAEKAEKELKAMVPSDAERIHGHGVEITRDRASRLSLRAMKEAA